MQGLFAEESLSCRAARVLVDGLNDMVLDYAIPPGMAGVTRGSRVEVPLRGRGATGTVLCLVPPEAQWRGSLRPLRRLVNEEPVVSPVLMDLAERTGFVFSTISRVVNS